MKEIISCVLDNNLSQRLLLSCWFSIILFCGSTFLFENFIFFFLYRALVYLVYKPKQGWLLVLQVIVAL